MVSAEWRRDGAATRVAADASEEEGPVRTLLALLAAVLVWFLTVYLVLIVLGGGAGGLEVLIVAVVCVVPAALVFRSVRGRSLTPPPESF